MFELRSVNRSLQQKALTMGEDGMLDSLQGQPLSLLSEIQQSQVSHAYIHTHSHACTHTYKNVYVPWFFLLTRLKKPF